VGDLGIELSLIQAHSASAKKVGDGIGEFETYIRNNCEFILNFDERRRQGETISGVLESTINQVVSRCFVKRQQMQSTLRGAHLLLQTPNEPSTTSWRTHLSTGIQGSAPMLFLYKGGAIAEPATVSRGLQLSYPLCLRNQLRERLKNGRGKFHPGIYGVRFHCQHSHGRMPTLQ